MAGRAARGIEYWSLFMAQIIYVSTRTFAIAVPLAVVYEILSTCIITFKSNYAMKTILLFRIILVGVALLLAASLQYVFDLTFIAGERALYIYYILLLTVGFLMMVPAAGVKWAVVLVYPVISLAFWNEGIFAEPWTALAVSSNWLFMVFFIFLVPVAGEYLLLIVYLFVWALIIIIYYAFIGIHNDRHSFSSYF